MIEEILIQYGALGAFAAYLIFDRHVLLKKMQKTIESNTIIMETLEATIRHKVT